MNSRKTVSKISVKFNFTKAQPIKADAYVPAMDMYAASQQRAFLFA